MTLSTKDTNGHEEPETFLRSSEPVPGMTNDEAPMTKEFRMLNDEEDWGDR